MSIVLHLKARERRNWIASLAAHAFAMPKRARDGTAQDSVISASPMSGQRDNRPPSQHDPKAEPGGDSDEDAAFNAFFAQHEGALYGYLRRMLPTHEAALDAAQEAFFRAWQHFEVIRGYDRPQAWLFRVATNLALDALRRRQRAGVLRLLDGHETHPSASNTADTGNAGDALSRLMDPFDMEQALAQRDQVNRALAQLPERQRAAVLLWAAHGLTCAEIAETMEITEVNVRQLLSRGRARFREVYEQA